MRVEAVVAAAGSGRRMAARDSKVFLPLAGRPLLAHTLGAFEAAGCVERVVVVVREEDVERCRRLAARYGLAKVGAVVPGGAERQDSVARGLEAVGPGTDVVVVHDGARPLVSPALIAATVEAAARRGAALAAVPVKDTVKVVEDGRVTATPERRRLFAAQTPQAFRAGLLREAFARAAARGWRATDDAALVEACGHPVAVVPGEETNLKVTTPLDLRLAEAVLAGREGRPPSGSDELRVGIGFDAHRLVAGRRLVLGGVEVPHHAGLAGHSDADAAAHALIDALLGAAGAGDIGRWFPDDDEAYRDADSLQLLGRVVRELQARGWRVVNCDVTVVAEQPRLAPHVDAMRARLAASLGVAPERVGVKAKTTEGLGFTGRQEGIAAQAVALLARAGGRGPREGSA